MISERRVRPADLAEGRFDFSDKVEQKGDVKTFGGSVPPEALAAGRVVVEFTDKAQESQLPDMSRYRKGNSAYCSVDRVQLALGYVRGAADFFSPLNTPGTAGSRRPLHWRRQRQTLGDVKVQLDTPFASLFLTALDRKEDLTRIRKKALITVLARQSNTGLPGYFIADTKVVPWNGGPPILLEPVKATVTIAGRPIAAVNILDHDGRRTDRTLAVTDGRFTLDGAKDKAIYYEVVFR